MKGKGPAQKFIDANKGDSDQAKIDKQLRAHLIDNFKKQLKNLLPLANTESLDEKSNSSLSI
jgi:hypothetical protein